MKKEKYFIIFDGTLHDVVEESVLKDYFESENLSEDDIIKIPISEEWLNFPDEEQAIDYAQVLDQEI